ncbi:hypothetical protein BUALT_Bualt13G0117800 [Buddleja alternifolia]|uniref:TF-B3 domain-containing protein n=1 Tax=Buddleja alternifolia TaxID=168488 RepID=A0AAV6WXS7_9LAMI|nr:hypothetical protein BUALT_Bualt13G0117800 [Buddleja alternifolia]
MADDEQRRKDKGKAKVGEPTTPPPITSDENDPSDHDDQEYQLPVDDHHDDDVAAAMMNLPFKKRRIDDDDDDYDFDDPLPDVRILHDTAGTSSSSSNPIPNLTADDQFPPPLYDPARPVQDLEITLALQDLCLSKPLSLFDVTHIDGKLLLDPYEASLLINDTRLINEPPSPSFERMLLAFDEDDRQFNLHLSVNIVRGLPIYYLARDWSLFVRMHNLRCEDEIMFYRIMDDNVADDYYYVLRYFKKPRDVTPMKQMDVGEAKDSKGHYRLEVKRKEDGGIILKLAKKH